MRNILIGTLILISGALLFPFMLMVGINPHTCQVVSISVATIGFIIQIGSAIRMKYRNDQEIKRMKAESDQHYITMLRQLPNGEEILRRLAGNGKGQ